MIKFTILFISLSCICAASAYSQTQEVAAERATVPSPAAITAPVAVSSSLSSVSSTSARKLESRALFPKDWIRGYVNFDVAPSHNEPDLGRCSFPQPVSAGGAASACTAYGRYFLSGYIEIQPLARTLGKHFFIFIQPTMTFGRNIPQVSYTASMEPISFDRSIGLAFELPRNFEIRATQHQVNFLGRYSNKLGSADLGTNGPYGLYSTFGIRWSFGAYGHQSAPGFW